MFQIGLSIDEHNEARFTRYTAEIRCWGSRLVIRFSAVEPPLLRNFQRSHWILAEQKLRRTSPPRDNLEIETEQSSQCLMTLPWSFLLRSRLSKINGINLTLYTFKTFFEFKLNIWKYINFSICIVLLFFEKEDCL